MQPEKKYNLKSGEVASMLGVSRTTVWNYSELGLLPFVEERKGKNVWRYYSVEDVEIVRHRIASEAQGESI